MLTVEDIWGVTYSYLKHRDISDRTIFIAGGMAAHISFYWIHNLVLAGIYNIPSMQKYKIQKDKWPERFESLPIFYRKIIIHRTKQKSSHLENTHNPHSPLPIPSPLLVRFLAVHARQNKFLTPTSLFPCIFRSYSVMVLLAGHLLLLFPSFASPQTVCSLFFRSTLSL